MKKAAFTFSELSTWIDRALQVPLQARAGWVNEQPTLTIEQKRALQKLVASQPDTAARPLNFLSEAAGDVGPFAGVFEQARASEIIRSAFSSDQKIDRYVLKHCLGRGGMGEVWLAHRPDQPSLGDIAIKLPLNWVRDQSVAVRFLRERDILARLSHPGIVRILDAGVSDHGVPFIAMEYVAGVPLLQYVSERRLTVSQRVALLQAVAEVIIHAHNALVLHRDLKPGNILVTSTGQIKVLDFGTAQLIDGIESDLTRMAGLPMTQSYASPEQMLREPLGVATDVYSLGVVLFELLTGSRPQRPRSDGAALSALDPSYSLPSESVVADRTTEHGHTTVRAWAQALRGDLDAITVKALADAPQDRYGSMHEFALDLSHAQHKRPIAARGGNRLYRIERFLRRNARAVTAATVSIVLIFLAVIAAYRESVVASRELARAQSVERFLMGVFDAKSFGLTDVLNAQGSTARELLDRGTMLLREDKTLAKGSKLDVIARLSQINADLSAHDIAHSLASEGLALIPQIADTKRNRELALELQLTRVSSRAFLRAAPAEISAYMVEIDRTIASSGAPLSVGQRFLFDAITARVDKNVCEPESIETLTLQVSPLIFAGLQHRVAACAGKNDALALQFAERYLQLAHTTFGARNPRVVHAELLVLERARLAGDVAKATDAVARIKHTLTNGLPPGNPLRGGWWSPIGEAAIDSPLLLAAALEIAQYEIEYGTAHQGAQDAAIAATISARIRSGADKTLRVQARATYAELLLKAGRYDLAYLNARAAVNALNDRQDELALRALWVWCDALALKGDFTPLQSAIHKANQLHERLGYADEHAKEAARLIRMTMYDGARGQFASAQNYISLAHTKIAHATYARRSLDESRVSLLQAWVSHKQAQAYKSGTPFDANTEAPRIVIAAVPPTSAQRLAYVADVLRAEIGLQNGNVKARCSALASLIEMEATQRAYVLSPLTAFDPGVFSTCGLKHNVSRAEGRFGAFDLDSTVIAPSVPYVMH